MLTSLYPSAALTPPPATLPTGHRQRVSAYDNLCGSSGDLDDDSGGCDGDGDDSSDEGTVTEFSEPWDSNRWDELLSSPSASSRRKRKNPLNTSVTSAGSAASDLPSSPLPPPLPAPIPVAASSPASATLRAATPPTPPATSGRKLPAQQLFRTRSFKDKMDPLVASPRLLALRSTCNSQPGRNLQVITLTSINEIN